jgi:glycosyltransferase involved in cell wall biosynthesis
MLEPWALRHKAWKKWPYFLLRERAHLLAADVVLATAPTEAARLASLLGRRPIDTLPLGLTGNARPDYAAARSELGWRDDERVLLYLSRIHPKKGLHMLLEALALVRNVGNVRVVIVGGGAPDYVERVRSLGDSLLGRVRAVDWVGEVWGVSRWRYFQGADLFCLTTHSENFGLAVLEALQVGTPVLTTTGTPWGGWLAAPRGYITEPVTGAIADGLRAWLAAPEWSDSDRAALGEWAVDEFHWKHLGQRYAALYQRLLP